MPANTASASNPNGTVRTLVNAARVSTTAEAGTMSASRRASALNGWPSHNVPYVAGPTAQLTRSWVAPASSSQGRADVGSPSGAPSANTPAAAIAFQP